MSAIYIHIPFCVRKCGYCDFFSVPFSADTEDRYIDTLCGSIERESNRDTEIKTVYIGGGTPALLSEKSFERIFASLAKFRIGEDAEITSEANPATVSYEKLCFMRKYFNRISIGVQSFSDRELQILGRVHNGEQARKTVLDAKRAGFDNISIDLMYSLPFQTEESFSRSLETACLLPITHISAYELSIEENTPFGKNRTYFQNLIDDDCDFDLCLRKYLKDKGFERYEVSNYAKPDFMSLHNINYWNNGDYFGFGAGAVGYKKGERYKFISDIEKYIESGGTCLEFSEKVSRKDRAFENLMLGLRMIKGFSVNKVTDYLSGDEKKLFYEKIRLMEEYVCLKENYLFCTEKGLDFLNSVLLNLFCW